MQLYLSTLRVFSSLYWENQPRFALINDERASIRLDSLSSMMSERAAAVSLRSRQWWASEHPPLFALINDEQARISLTSLSSMMSERVSASLLSHQWWASEHHDLIHDEQASIRLASLSSMMSKQAAVSLYSHSWWASLSELKEFITSTFLKREHLHLMKPF